MEYVYDLRSRKTIGSVRRLTTTIIPNRASFFVLCSKPAPIPRLTLDQKNPQRGSVVKATIIVPAAEGLHAFRIRAKAGGKQLDWLHQNILAGQNPVEFDLPIAFNDPVGEYEVSAIDLFTNKATTLKVSVKP